MTTQAKWVPGFENRIASTQNGALVRVKKSGTFKKITTPYFEFDGVRYHSPYLVALAWLAGTGTRVRPKDGDPLNWSVENLEWVRTVRDRIHSNRARTLQTVQSDTAYLQPAGYPKVWVKSDGTAWRMTSMGDLKRVKGGLNGGQVYVGFRVSGDSGQRNRLNAVVLKELVADLWIGNRPSPFHRARLLDGDPWNTNPANLEWYLPPSGRPVKEIFSPVTKAPNSRPQQSPTVSREEVKDLLKESWESLLKVGARPMKGYPALWALPSGSVLVLDSATGRSLYPTVDITGTVKACGLTIRARDFIADAFAGTRYAPKLPHPRNATQTARTIDGDNTNLHPSNLEWSPCTGKAHKLYSFESNPYDNC